MKTQILKSGSQFSLSSKAYFLIRERILRGLLRPGDVVSSRLLAEEFQMSLLPVSQALRQLERDKLIECRPRAGTRVRIPSTEEMRGRSIVREALEAQSARLCCMHATMKEQLELLRMAEQLDTLFDRFGRNNDPELRFAVHTHHFELHMRIAEFARCPELKETLEMNDVLIYNWFLDVAAKPRPLPPGFHVQLIQGITGSDPLAADEAMRFHVQFGFADALQQIIPQVTNDWRLRRSHDRQSTEKNDTPKIL